MTTSRLRLAFCLATTMAGEAATAWAGDPVKVAFEPRVFTNSAPMGKEGLSLLENLKYSEYPGVSHFSWETAFAEPDLLKWLFEQKRSAASRDNSVR